MPELTYEDVVYQIKKACQIYRLYKKERPGGFKSCLKSFSKEEADGAWVPSPKEIDIADEVEFLWLRWLTPENRRLVWFRFDGMPWKVLAYQENISIRQARYKVDQSIKIILNNLKKMDKKSRYYQKD